MSATVDEKDDKIQGQFETDGDRTMEYVDE